MLAEPLDLIPGPPHRQEVLDSQSIHDIAQYPIDTVAACFDRYPGMRRIGRGHDPWHWKWKWQEGDRTIDLNFTLFEAEPPTWGGSKLEPSCTINDLLTLWRHVLQQFPAVWVHDEDCKMYTPQTFLTWVAAWD